MLRPLSCLCMLSALFFSVAMCAQDAAPTAPPQQAPTTEAAPAQHPPAVSALSRLGVAHKAYLKRGTGNSIPYNVISAAFEAWPRFTLVRDPDKADIIVEISAPEESGGVSISGSTTIPSYSSEGRPEPATTTHSMPASKVEMVVLDQHNHLRLWFGSEQPKGAMKQRAREDHLVDAAQALFTRFHDRLEPPEAPEKK